MLDEISKYFSLSSEDRQKVDFLFEEIKYQYKDYHDPWGLDIEACKAALTRLLPLYKNYFKVRVFGKERVPNRPIMIISNHSGQVPIDGVLLAICFLWDVAPPRILRGMIERFMVKIPFLGDATAKTGSILGDRKNCEYLLDNAQSIMVFPEGVKGVSKNTKDYYKLQKFTTGFLRIAIAKKVEILPVAVIGAEEMYPLVYHSKRLAKVFGLPALPITPLFPIAGPLGVIPLPSPIDIHIGKPYRIDEFIDPQMEEKVLMKHVRALEHKIQMMINRGLVKRRPFMDSFRLPVFKYFRERNKDS